MINIIYQKGAYHIFHEDISYSWWYWRRTGNYFKWVHPILFIKHHGKIFYLDKCFSPHSLPHLSCNIPLPLTTIIGHLTYRLIIHWLEQMRMDWQTVYIDNDLDKSFHCVGVDVHVQTCLCVRLNHNPWDKQCTQVKEKKNMASLRTLFPNQC